MVQKSPESPRWFEGFQIKNSTTFLDPRNSTLDPRQKPTLVCAVGVSRRSNTSVLHKFLLKFISDNEKGSVCEIISDFNSFFH